MCTCYLFVKSVQVQTTELMAYKISPTDAARYRRPIIVCLCCFRAVLAWGSVLGWIRQGLALLHVIQEGQNQKASGTEPESCLQGIVLSWKMSKHL